MLSGNRNCDAGGMNYITTMSQLSVLTSGLLDETCISNSVSSATGPLPHIQLLDEGVNRCSASSAGTGSTCESSLETTDYRRMCCCGTSAQCRAEVDAALFLTGGWTVASTGASCTATCAAIGQGLLCNADGMSYINSEPLVRQLSRVVESDCSVNVTQGTQDSFDPASDEGKCTYVDPAGTASCDASGSGDEERFCCCDATATCRAAVYAAETTTTTTTTTTVPPETDGDTDTTASTNSAHNAGLSLLTLGILFLATVNLL